MNNLNGGQPITKQLSYSLITPQTLTGYTEFFRQNSNRVDGWMEIKVGSHDTWKKQWFIFDEGVLKYQSNPNFNDTNDSGESKMIPMDSVITLRADNTYGNTTILITTIENKVFLRLANTDEKSVALVLTHLMNSSRAKSTHLNLSSQQQQLHGQLNHPGQPFQQQYNYQNEKNFLSHHHPQHHRAAKNKRHGSLKGNNSNEVVDPKNEKTMLVNAFNSNYEDRAATSTGIAMGEGRNFPTVTGKEAFLRLKSFDILHNSNNNSPLSNDLNMNSNIPGKSSSMYVGSMPTVFSHIESRSDHRYSNNMATINQDIVPLISITNAIPISNLNLNTTHHHHHYRSNSSDGRNNSVDKVATSYKDEDSIAFKLECILRSPSGSGSSKDHRSRSSSNSSDISALNDLDIDDEDEGMIFELDESVELKSANNNNHDSAHVPKQQRSTSSCSNNPFIGKALSVSQTLSDAATTPSRRGSNTLSRSYSTSTASLHSNPRDDVRSSINELPMNYSEFLMWHSGYCTKLGPRSANEDRYVCAPNIYEKILPSETNNKDIIDSIAINNNRKLNNIASNSIANNNLIGGGSVGSAGYFSVYDGHGGQQAAEFLEQHLLEDIINHPLFHHDIEQAVIDTCIQTDKKFLRVCEEKKIYCGTTAIGVFIIGNKLLVFNIGDSQAVLCTSGVTVEMSDSHKPGRKDEMERIQKAGGWITEEKELYMGRLHRMDLSDPVVRDKAHHVSWVTIHRVCGELSVSRSIGDPDYKQFIPGALVDAYFLWPENHNQIFMADLVIPEPECKLHEITNMDDFIIIASDGLWDVVSTQEAIMKVKEAFQLNKTPTEAAEELCELSIRLGSSDNVTIVIVRFMHPVI